MVHARAWAKQTAFKSKPLEVKHPGNFGYKSHLEECTLHLGGKEASSLQVSLWELVKSDAITEVFAHFFFKLPFQHLL